MTEKLKCVRCRSSEAAVEDGHEFCHECIKEMIMPEYDPAANDLLAEHIKKEVAE